MKPHPEGSLTQRQTEILSVYQTDGLVKSCAHCRRIRTFFGIFTEVPAELTDLAQLPGVHITHGICNACLRRELADYDVAI